jgi:hypothetical protein
VTAAVSSPGLDDSQTFLKLPFTADDDQHHSQLAATECEPGRGDATPSSQCGPPRAYPSGRTDGPTDGSQTPVSHRHPMVTRITASSEQQAVNCSGPVTRSQLKSANNQTVMDSFLCQSKYGASQKCTDQPVTQQPTPSK